jgi:thiosulfate dehydrogenase [quinone] large subunit
MSMLRDNPTGVPIGPPRDPAGSTGSALITAGHRRTAMVLPSFQGALPAVLRISMGFVFLWAFLDKVFGLGYATPSARAWVHGGSPTKGFLNGVSAGPFQSAFHSLAGDTWVDWLFMIGLVSIGVALVFGIAMRVAAISGALMLAFMWAAEWPLAKHGFDGAATSSSNPFMDSHLVYALVLFALVAVSAGGTWSLRSRWIELPIVARNPWLA